MMGCRPIRRSSSAFFKASICNVEGSVRPFAVSFGHEISIKRHWPLDELILEGMPQFGGSDDLPPVIIDACTDYPRAGTFPRKHGVLLQTTDKAEQKAPCGTF